MLENLLRISGAGVKCDMFAFRKIFFDKNLSARLDGRHGIGQDLDHVYIYIYIDIYVILSF